MDIIKTLWPTPFKVKEKDLVSMLIQLIIFLVLVAIAGVVIGFLNAIPVVGIITSIIGSLLGIYSLIGIILCVCKFLGAVK